MAVRCANHYTKQAVDCSSIGAIYFFSLFLFFLDCHPILAFFMFSDWNFQDICFETHAVACKYVNHRSGLDFKIRETSDNKPVGRHERTSQ